MYETNALAARFAELIIDNYSIVEKNLKEVASAKAYLERELDYLKAKHFKSYANFVLIDVGSPKRAMEIGESLRKKKILIKSGFEHESIRNCIRITIGSAEQMKGFIRNFAEVLLHV